MSEATVQVGGVGITCLADLESLCAVARLAGMTSEAKVETTFNTVTVSQAIWNPAEIES